MHDPSLVRESDTACISGEIPAVLEMLGRRLYTWLDCQVSTLAEGYGGLKPSIDQTYKITVILS